MERRIEIAVDVRFTLDVPGHPPVTGALVGQSPRLTMRVDDPVAFAGRGDTAAVRGVADALAEQGLVVEVVVGDRTLVELGATRPGWLQRRVIGSANLRVASLRGALVGARGRAATGAGVLPGRALVPPATLRPLVPTFRRLVRGAGTTHDPRRGGNPRLVLTVGNARVPESGRVIHPLRAERTRIGSGSDCEIRLEGLQPLHAEVLHDDRDEFVVLDHAHDGSTRVNGLAGQGSILRTGARVQVGEWSLAYRRAEYADHGRPFGGRVGGEAGHQRSQPDPRAGLTLVETPGPSSPPEPMSADGPVLVAGGTGFVGRRLVAALAEAGRDVRVMTRHPERYEGPAAPVHGDVAEADSLAEAVAGCHAAYYLVHSLGDADFERRDASAAEAFGRAAGEAGVSQIIYLGGLGDDADDLSAHLRSRREVEGLLGSGGVPVTVLRAGIVVGHGGISWEITRQLVEHLPAMITPRWVRTRTQPIAVADVVRYLVGVLDNPEAVGRVFEVGGSEVLRYSEMLQRVARIEHRPLPIVPVPLLTPGLSSRWLAFVTSVDTRAGRNLIDSMVNEVVVSDTSIRDVVPFEPMGYDEAVRVALAERRDAG